MKTLYVITNSNWGGPQKYVFDQATMRLKYPEARVGVILNGNGELTTRLEKAQVPIHLIPFSNRSIQFISKIKTCISLFKIYQKEQPDVIHINTNEISILGAFMGRVHNVFAHKKSKIIFTVHGWSFNEDRNIISKCVAAFVAYLTIQLCHEIIVLSKSEYDQVLRWRNAAKKLRIEKLRVGQIPFKTREEARQILSSKNPRLAEHSHKRWVGTIAELHPNKDLEFGIKALLELRDRNIIWVIIGEGPERSKLQKQILEADLQNKIFLIGYVPQASELLKAFDVFMLPSIKEGLPYTLIEAEQAKLPIIATRVGGISEHFVKPHNQIVPPKDAAQLAEAIIKVI